jgi:hypothetical protein
LEGELTKNGQLKDTGQLNNITMNIKEIDCQNVCRTKVSQVRVQWQTLVLVGSCFQKEREREREREYR